MHRCKPAPGLDLICRNERNLTFDLCRRFAEKLGGEMEESDAGYDVMLSKPGELSARLTEGKGRGTSLSSEKEVPRTYQARSMRDRC